MIRLFNYPGCKVPFINIIDKHISRSGCTASVLINSAGLSDFGIPKFESFVINDMSREVVRIIQSFKDCEYHDIVSMYENIFEEFGSIKTKDSYYSFRNAYNKRFFNSDTIEEGLFLHIAARASINSLFRIGPNGYNQFSGLRGDTIGITHSEFLQIKTILKNTDITNCDYKTVFDKHDSEQTLWFLDPPYALRPIQGSYYKENEFNNLDFLKAVKNLKGKIVYTDVYSEEILELTGLNYSIMKDKQNISPGKNKEGVFDYKEAIYFNF